MALTVEEHLNHVIEFLLSAVFEVQFKQVPQKRVEQLQKRVLRHRQAPEAASPLHVVHEVSEKLNCQEFVHRVRLC